MASKSNYNDYLTQGDMPANLKSAEPRRGMSNSGAMSQLNSRIPPRQMKNMEQSRYVSQSALAYNNSQQRIPVVSQKELSHLRYRPEAKNFDRGETKQIADFESRERTIQELDTGMSPFMKNQNDHYQRMKRSVARQEKIASQYTKPGGL